MGCEVLGMPCGMQFPSGGGGISGCTYGSGSCGGMIYGLTTDPNTGLTIGSYPGETACFGHPGEGCTSEFWNGSEWEVGVPISSDAARVLGDAGRTSQVGLNYSIAVTAPNFFAAGAGGAVEAYEAANSAINLYLSNPEVMADVQQGIGAIMGMIFDGEYRRSHGCWGSPVCN